MLNAYESSAATTAAPASENVGTTPFSKRQRDGRESICLLLLGVLSAAVVFSSASIFKYALRDKAVYDELVDYLDKTVSISKINYNPVFGIYELRPNELDILGDQRKYKSLIWTFLFVDIATLLFFAIPAFLYFSVQHFNGIVKALFWMFSVSGILYALAEVCVFTVLLSPFSTNLPNATIALMDHSIPYNPGGLAQIENRFGCIFDQNLYDTFKRHLNPRNTCDPFLMSSFIPNLFLGVFIVVRSLAVAFFVLLLLMPNSALSRAIGALMLRLKPTIHYRKKRTESGNPNTNKLPSYYASPAKTTFGVKEQPSTPNPQQQQQQFVSSPLPTQIPAITAPPGHIDHSINYNNAALFAVSGAIYGIGGQQTQYNGGGSRSCSEISIAKCEGFAVPNMTLRGSTHTTNSLVSEV